ncbi:LapA family protein [Pseudalkalibacillus salsuginis]|uniref:LapA family protein n=1 Tax=Pseudalkalibacillus salsuginis TaxID=2910972 RepID=UPI001F1BCC50|nr:lipopolysaccharide assembly protein LapA domain-containing protein [Pseudalkalibacillus salsuginis]MCF6408630.1 lipopolysaccharide assembly protein LapA domain-containing protein [Pseudalkalibacillus salsuginis]
MVRKEWSFIIVLLFSIIVAVFAVINVKAVEVDYLVGTAHWPLVLVILGSAMLGALVVGFAGSARLYSMKKEIRSLRKRNEHLINDQRSSDHKTKKDRVSKKNTSQTANSSDNSIS